MDGSPKKNIYILEGAITMETMEKVIENVKDVAPAEAAQTVVKVATMKPNKNVIKTGGIIAGAVALVVGVGFAIYSAVKPKEAVEANEPDCEAETHEDNEVQED
jgi:hypothetical protein